MESSIFIVAKMPSPQHKKQLLLMLGEDAPIFEEEVAKKWQAMFHAIEDLTPPGDVISLSDDLVFFNWLAGFADDALQEYRSTLIASGFNEFAAYFWQDEEEGFLMNDGKGWKSVAKPKLDKESLPELKLPKGWEASSKTIMQQLVQLVS